MLRLVYISTARQKFEQAEVLDLLNKSQRSNARRDITGILLYHHNEFFQVLQFAGHLFLQPQVMFFNKPLVVFERVSDQFTGMQEDDFRPGLLCQANCIIQCLVGTGRKIGGNEYPVHTVNLNSKNQVATPLYE